MQSPVGLDAVVFFFQNLDVTKATSASLISTFALARSPGSYDAVRVRAFPGRASWRDLSVRCWKRRGVGASRIAVSKNTSLHAVTSDLRASSMTAAASRFRLATATKTIAKVSLRYVDMHLIKPP